MLATVQNPSLPRIWSTESEVDLQSRLARLPFYQPQSGLNGFVDSPDQDLRRRMQRLPFYAARPRSLSVFVQQPKYSVGAGLGANPKNWPDVWTTSAEVDLQNRLSRLPFYAPANLGDETSDKIAKFAPQIQQALEDPALPAIFERVKQLRALAERDAGVKPPAPGTPPPTAPTAPKIGIGLQKFLMPLDLFIAVRKDPWIPWVVGIGSVLLIGGIGFGVGRAVTRRRLLRTSK